MSLAVSSVCSSLSACVSTSRTAGDDKDPYTVFVILVKWGDNTWTIARRFHEFDELHASLSKKLQIMPILPVKTWFKSFEPNFIEQRRSQLDSYIKTLLNNRVAMSSNEFKLFLDLAGRVSGINDSIPSERIILKDPKFGVNSMVYDHQNGILLTACEDAFVLSRIDSYITNVRLPWETKGATVPIGALNVWIRDDSNDWSCVTSLYYDCQASFVAWDEIKRQVYVGCETGAVLIYNLEIIDHSNVKLTSLSELKHHSSRITGLFVDVDNNRLIASSRDKFVSIFDIEKSSLISTTPCGDAWLSSMFYDAPSKRIFLGTYANSILIYDTNIKVGENMKLLAVLDGQKGSVRALWYDSPSRYCFAGCFDWTVAMWDIGVPGKEAVRSRQAAQLKNGPSSKVKAITYCQSTRYVIAGYENGLIGIFESRTAELVHVIEAHTADIVQLTWLDSFRILISASRDCDVKFWLFPDNIGVFPSPTSSSSLPDITVLTKEVIQVASNLVSDVSSVASDLLNVSFSKTEPVQAEKPTKSTDASKPGYFFSSGQFASVTLHTAPEYANLKITPSSDTNVPNSIKGVEPTKKGSSTKQPSKVSAPARVENIVNSSFENAISSNNL